jgi:hypothetical protein
MTQTIAVPDTTVTIEASSNAIWQVLAAAWAQTTDEAEPDWLRAVATGLIGDYHQPDALPTPESAHQLLTAALDVARDAHQQATAERAAVEQDWRTFHIDVRRRAGEAVNDRHICLEGTNAALRDFGIEELRVEYRVQVLVPVNVDVRAHDADEAYDRANDRIRGELGGDGLDIDLDGLRRYDATVIDEDVDPDD